MKIHARVLRNDPILVDRAANYFGSPAQMFMIRARIRTNGTLTLTEESLTFEQHDSGAFLEIPIEEIQQLGMGRWHEGMATFVPVLKIIYRGNLVFGVHVADPDRWIEAIEAVASRRSLPFLTASERNPQTVFRLSRMVIIGFVLLLVLSMALPMFFSWMHGQTIRQSGAPLPQSLQTGANP
jgi:uncharacterized protein (DUF1778 family)